MKLEMLNSKSVSYPAVNYYLPDLEDRQENKVLQKRRVKVETFESFYDPNECQLKS